MIFNSLIFWLFFAIVYVLYRRFPLRAQNYLLLLASYVFYGWWDWRFLLLIMLTSFCSWGSGLWIQHVRTLPIKETGVWRDDRMAWWISALNIGLNLLILGFFKYYNFFVDSFVALFAQLDITLAPRTLHIILPVGISFYTFQALSYSIDVFRRKMEPTRDILGFFTFVAYFPQLVAGPIERASHLLPQIQKPRTITKEGMQSGTWLMVWGLFKKCVIADNLAILADAAFDGGGGGGAVYLLGVYAFAFQIFCDFSGYSDIARGLSKWMGIELMVNFNIPYIARNPKEFWSRWHISLSTWLRDYLYIPLGGNRKGSGRMYINLLATMILGGLWHGAAWTFVVWGIYHGLLLIVYHAWNHLFFPGKRQDSGHFSWIRRLIMFHLVCIGWLFFRAPHVTQAWNMLKGIVSSFTWNLSAANMLTTIMFFCLPLWIVQSLQAKSNNLEAPLYLSIVPRICLYTVILAMLLYFGNTGGGAFIYFQF